MAATVWKGHLSFGLISIPVKLHRAARAEKVSFRQLHGTTSTRVRQVYVQDEPEELETRPSASVREATPIAAAPGAALGPRRPEPIPIRGQTVPPPLPAPAGPSIVDRSELVKGYEYAKGHYVTISKEELQKITPETAREMQVLEFVKLAEVDPIFFETSYYVVPESAGERAYALLFEALRRSGHVALGQFAMHNREHIVVVRPGRSGLVLHTMFYESEIRSDDEHRADTSKIPEKELTLALALIENLTAPFDPTKYHDTYKEKLDAMIAAKIAGEEIVEEPASKREAATDILAALERSLALTRKPAASEAKPTSQPAKRKKAK